jgi:membrane protein
MRLKEIGQVAKETGLKWWRDDTFRLGAALAYYTIFSLAPVVLIVVFVAGLVFGQETARRQLLEEIRNTVGAPVSRAIEATVTSENTISGDLLATAVSVVVLLIGATTVFAELQSALNNVWGVRARSGGVWDLVKVRFWSFTVVLGIGFLLLVSLVISAALAALVELFPWAASGAWLWRLVNGLLSFGLITLLFALIYKILPDVAIAWSDVWIGAALTALLFTVGKYLIGLYLGRSSWVSAYGAAGSLVVVLVWVYYSSQILLFGAAFTQVYARRSGKPLVPTKNAELVKNE